jgi:GH15 family glucan-1,4-alpha-glucosidase
MARPVMLGNGSLTVGLNEQGLVHDFYYPYVGLDNLTNARSLDHKIGIWVDNTFSWVDDGSWEVSVDFRDTALISKISMVNNKLQLKLFCEDFVDSEFNVLCRQITIANQSDREREVRLFMHQVFQISRAGRADTGLFVPEENYILDYKGRCSLLIYGCDEGGKPFDQFAIGNYGIEGKEGTFKDAEDGELSNSAVEHGGVDTVIRLVKQVAPNSETKIDYWIIASDSQYTCERIQASMISSRVSGRMETTERHWREWLDTASNKLAKVDPKYIAPINKSLMVIKAHTDRRGGIIASCDSSIYNYGRDYYSYVWPRDGAYAIWPLIRLGFREEAKNFFEFCRDILTLSGYLMHKYQPDRAIGSTWHPLLHGKHKELAIQEDETAGVLFMLGEYYKYTKDEDFIRNMYETFIQPAANFMTDFVDEKTNLPHATYDLWEEKFLTTTYTTAVVYRSLLVAVMFAEKFEYPDDVVNWKAGAEHIKLSMGQLFNQERGLYNKGYLIQEDGTINTDSTLDVSSLYGIMMYAPDLDHNLQERTLSAIEEILFNKSPSGGSPRYENDNYFASNPKYLGNPWFVTTLWIAQYYIRNSQIDKAKDIIEWALKHSLFSGVIPEQVNPTTAEAVSVTPLVWSHSELINTILDLYDEDLTV